MNSRARIPDAPHASLDLLTTAQAARYLGLSIPTLERFRSTRGDGPAYIKLGDKKTSRVSYLRIDLDRWILAHRHRGGAEKGDDQ